MRCPLFPWFLSILCRLVGLQAEWYGEALLYGTVVHQRWFVFHLPVRWLAIGSFCQLVSAKIGLVCRQLSILCSRLRLYRCLYLISQIFFELVMRHRLYRLELAASGWRCGGYVLQASLRLPKSGAVNHPSLWPFYLPALEEACSEDSVTSHCLLVVSKLLLGLAWVCLPRRHALDSLELAKPCHLVEMTWQTPCPFHSYSKSVCLPDTSCIHPEWPE